eukprot:CAMPEP_0172607516 /NCGR_PEP_ID=MMETSP1068-20121228/27681_1 /TAXON_ID=35684 /ORGANISM="Pseudopedinella elastica, Strain CCMP716" /LENGTH=183 /DNA_ID=CAMNT_0013410545 /DNA_START=350 /DNA_END=901 /DNA_ORIENTATION=-
MTCQGLFALGHAAVASVSSGSDGPFTPLRACTVPRFTGRRFRPAFAMCAAFLGLHRRYNKFLYGKLTALDRAPNFDGLAPGNAQHVFLGGIGGGIFLGVVVRVELVVVAGVVHDQDHLLLSPLLCLERGKEAVLKPPFEAGAVNFVVIVFEAALCCPRRNISSVVGQLLARLWLAICFHPSLA